MDIRAFHKPTKTWRWAALGSDGTYARIDPGEGESLDDFDVYEVRMEGKNTFRPRTQPMKIEKVLS